MNTPKNMTAPARLLQQLLVYVKLMRLDRPVGIWLLAWPMLWALWIAGNGKPDATILIVFMLGAVITRSAGCVINDVADRNFDGEVQRTQERPLVQDEIGVVEAIALFIGLGFIAIGLAAMLNTLSRIIAVAAVVIMVAYPFMKRFISVPQLVLGLAFGTAIPMAFAAQTNTIPQDAWFIFAITALWAVIYDTMYAMCDRHDDLAAGIRSTAILFGEADKFVIGAMQAIMLMALMLLGQRLDLTLWYYSAVVAVAAFMGYQQWLIAERDPDRCLQAFKNNHFIGMVVFIGLALHYLYAPAAT